MKMSDRRVRITLITAGLAVAATVAFAALPPKYQRAREFAAVVDTAAHQLADPIDRVEFAGDDLYLVHAGKCRLDVRIVDVPVTEALAGPRQFGTEAGTPECDR